MADSADEGATASIGWSSHDWTFSTSNGQRTFDLTAGAEGAFQHGIKVSTGAKIHVSASNSALVIIDMQNYFLSAALGRARGTGHDACDNLISHAIPAARRTGMQSIWLNWGLTDEDMKTMPAGVTRCFGFPAKMNGKEVIMDRHGIMRNDRTWGGLGAVMGEYAVPESESKFTDGKGKVDAGRTLFRDTWNAALYGPLVEHYKPNEGDVWLHKNRMSGLWNSETPCRKYLEEKGITTLFFAGVNTDQCVGGSLTDAFSNGYDCILLKDGCGTTSPACAQEAWEYNCENTFGFVTTCKDLWDSAVNDR